MIDFFRCIKNSRGQKNDFHLLDLHLLDHHHCHEHPRSSPCYSEPCTYKSDVHVCGACTGGTRRGSPALHMPWTSHATVGWCGGLVGGKPHQPTPHAIAKLLGLSKWRALAFRAGIHVTTAVMFCWCVMESNRLAYRRWTTRNM